MTTQALSNTCQIHGIEPREEIPLSPEEAAVAGRVEKIRANLINWQTCDKKNRRVNFHQEKEIIFHHAKNLIAALHNLDSSLVQPLPPTEEIDCQAIIDALSNAAGIGRVLANKTLDEFTLCFMDTASGPQRQSEFGVNFGPMLLDLQFKHETAMHEKMTSDTRAIEQDTANLEKIRQTLAQLHAHHKKDEGVNFEKQDAETFRKARELLDAVYAMDPAIWKKGSYNFDENDYQGLVDNLHGKTQAISRAISSKHLDIEGKTQLRNLLNNCLADTERRRERETDKIIDNQRNR